MFNKIEHIIFLLKNTTLVLYIKNKIEFIPSNTIEKPKLITIQYTLVFAKYINKNKVPDPDLIIRTGGEYRLSNFLIWQSAYSEFYTSEVLWPDFSKYDFFEALESYSLRNRKFGIN